MPQINTIRTDPDLCRQGLDFAWPEPENGEQPFLWTIARNIGTKEWQAFYQEQKSLLLEEADERWVVPAGVDADGNIVQEAELTDDGEVHLGILCVAELVLVGWKNVLDENNRPIPYSRAQAVKFLEDPSLSPDLMNFVWECAQQRRNFAIRRDEAAAKN